MKRKKYQCPICFKRYNKAGCLDNHLKKHSPDRDFIISQQKVTEVHYKPLSTFFDE